MSAKTEAQVQRMKTQTIGVEIEMAEITRNTAIKTIAQHFGTLSTVNHDGGSYDAWSCRDTQGRRWTVTRDVSIRATTDSRKAELATPILTYADLEDLQEIARKLRKKGAISNPEHGCGVHIHIGANGHNAKTLRNLANLMARAADTAEASITTHRDTECLTCTPPSRRAQSSSDFSNSTTPRKTAKAEYTQGSSRLTFSFASHSAKWQKR